MFYSLKGYIDRITADYIVLDVHDVCYQINVSHPEDFAPDQLVRVYTYYVVREDEQYLVGFLSEEEKDIFTSLISVKGIGPRTAINALSKTRPNDLKTAIMTANVSYLKKLPGIGAKAAAQIVLDLKGHLEVNDTDAPGLTNDALDAKEALKGLGFKASQIDNAFQKIDLSKDATTIIREALKVLG